MPNVQYFLGANSPQGFYSLYDQLIDPADARAVYILKGGPGCGKSTLMRQVALRAEQAGQPVEHILCSGDPSSLDAVVLPNLGAALVDGTAPHVVEPKLPGAVEHYVNLGDCYDADALAPLRAQLAECMTGYKACYQRAYRCLAAAAQVSEDIRSALLTPQLESRMEKRAAGILGREVRRKKGCSPGRVRQRFLSAVTHKGHITLFSGACSLCPKVYQLSDNYGLSHSMLAYLLSGVTAGGCDVVACPDPMFPQRLKHLLVPELGLAFLTCTGSDSLPVHHYRRLRLDAMVDPELLRKNRAHLRLSRRIAEALTEDAAAALHQAKTMHDELEAIYNPHVDFSQVGQIADRVIERLGL